MTIEQQALAPMTEPHEPGDLVERVARALAGCDGLILNEVCGYEAGDEECDSSTCPAAFTEDHDAEWERGCYRRRAQAALAASGADRMREALEKGSFMMTEPKRTESYPTARALVIGFQNGDDADDAMAAISAFMRANR